MLYGKGMASDRMMQAIGTLERAINQLEQDMEKLTAPAPAPSSSDMNASAARAALRSLDSLIHELKGRADG